MFCTIFNAYPEKLLLKKKTIFLFFLEKLRIREEVCDILFGESVNCNHESMMQLNFGQGLLSMTSSGAKMDSKLIIVYVQFDLQLSNMQSLYVLCLPIEQISPTTPIPKIS